MSTHACNRCGRVLSDPASVRAMYGPTCLNKIKTDMSAESDSPDAAAKLPFDAASMDVVCRRTASGTAFNIPHALVSHSPTGMEWGYAGSGPSDFALNILYRFTLDKQFSTKWHQEFKREFVAKLPEEGGVIPGWLVMQWIQSRRQVAHSQLALNMGGVRGNG
jgi:hypothetical protein